MDSSPDTRALLLQATGHLLRPLVRLLLRAGITFPVLADTLRQLFVEVASGEASVEEPRTDSRLSLLTGIHRKEIRRLREAEGAGLVEPAVVTLSSQILARWLGEARYLDGGGRPLILPRVTTEGSSFETLVRSVTTDVRPRAVLDEWLSQGLVTQEAGDHVRLVASAFLPKPGQAAQLFYFGRNLHDHIAAAAANVGAEERAPFPDLSVHYDRLPRPVALLLEEAARAAAGRLMLDINRVALDLTATADVALDDPGPTRRVNLGVYLYVEDEPPSESAP
jgi:hypothetical protein